METELEANYDRLAEAIDRAPEAKVDLFLTKLALLLGQELGSAETFGRLVDAAAQDL